METLGGFPNLPALWLRRAKPAFANAIVPSIVLSPNRFASQPASYTVWIGRSPRRRWLGRIFFRLAYSSKKLPSARTFSRLPTP
jgi:hypothetical protein